ncbi:ATP-binding cassette domain-containing protein [Erysipelothrix urinaevulpis]|uniref:ATP-binding cassette domain-containing protein n=1 Tax=Erysipelothrix urinaevulpis TaxID=2683717 RepID=UPI001914E299|nr:ATP-binding cassette domain-containing protein [Erysipelothrix urinaevulpis]
MKVFEIKELNKSYGNIKIFDDFSATITQNSFTVITGQSGSGKSTLLNIIGMLEEYDGGIILFEGRELPLPFSKKAVRILRNEIGYLFQNFALINEQTVEKNLSVAFMEKTNRKKKAALIEKALNDVGLNGFEKKLVAQCSGGEQQRIALARLLIKKSKVILCDEPTGSLDEDNATMVIQHLNKMKEQGKTIIVATHDPEVIANADKVIHIR